MKIQGLSIKNLLPFSIKWLIWSVVMTAVSVLTGLGEVGLKNQLSTGLIVFGIFVLFPYAVAILTRVSRQIDINRVADGGPVPNKAPFSEYSTRKNITLIGYLMLGLFSLALGSCFFGKIDPTAVFGELFLCLVSSSALYGRKYAFNGSKFWYFYILFALAIFILMEAALIFMGVVGSAIVSIGLIPFTVFPIIGMIKHRPGKGGESPHKWLVLLLTTSTLLVTILSTIGTPA